MFRSMKEVETFLEARNKFGIKPGLERVNYLLNQLKNPEKDLSIIHVAGTNGKGSTIQFINQALLANNYDVGIFTSPSFTGIRGHYIRNNSKISKADTIEAMNLLLPFIEELDKKQMEPTSFEIITVLAFLYFKDKVNFLLLETGMGGREDTTNCIVPIISIITNIAKDHMHYLGDTLAEIASHKAGIIKQNRPVIIGKVDKASEKVIYEEALYRSAPIEQLDSTFFYEVKSTNQFVWKTTEKKWEVELRLKGKHQMDNASLALMTLTLLEQQKITINWQKTLNQFKQTTLPGRFEKISDRPTIILDSAHNVAGIQAFKETVQSNYPSEPKKLLFAGFKDKQLFTMIRELREIFSHITLTTFEHERAATMKDFDCLANKNYVEYSPNWQESVESIRNKHTDKTIYFITGSLHFITLVREQLKTKDNC